MSKQIKMISPDGVTLHTANKYVTEDIHVTNGLPSYSGENEGGEALQDTLAMLMNNTLTSYSNSEATMVGDYLFYNKTNLESVDFPNATRINAYAFYQCSKLKNINFPKVTNSYGAQCFSGCYSLENVDFPLLKINGGSFMTNCQNLKTVKFRVANSLPNDTFRQCKNLTDIYLGYEGLVTMGSSTVFYTSGTTQGYINVHVRSAYVDQYATATNWSGVIASGQIVIVGDYSD